MSDEARQRINDRAGAAGGLVWTALGIDWYDTESQARRVAEHAAEEIHRLRQERDHYMALSAMNNVEALRSALVRTLNLLRIGMDVGLEPHEKDEANALLALFRHEPVMRPTDGSSASRKGE